MAADLEVNQVTIPVIAAYSSDSLWTEDEVKRRFQHTAQMYENACDGRSIKIELKELIRIESAHLQEISGYLNRRSLEQIEEILLQFTSKIRPLIIYTKQGFFGGSDEASEHLAQAYTFDGPRALKKFEHLAWNGFSFDKEDPMPFVMGNLDWNRFEELRPMHGITIIGQGSSEKHRFNKGKKLSTVFNVDGHELGHILLNDGGHRYTKKNIMAGENRSRFDQDQCQLIIAYHEREALRDKSVRKGMQKICSFAKKNNISNIPKFCE